MSHGASASLPETEDLLRARKALRAAFSSGHAQVYDQVVQDAESLYQALDKDGKGMLEREEVLAALQGMNLGLTEEVLVKFVSSMEANAEQLIEVGAFKRAMNPKPQGQILTPLFQHPRKVHVRGLACT